MFRMKNFKEQVFIIFVISIRNSSCVIDAIYDTVTEVSKLYSMINNMSMYDSSDAAIMGKLFTPSSEETIRNQANKIHEHLEQMEISMYPKLIINSLKLLPSEMILRDCLELIELSIENIDTLYRQFHESMNKKTSHYDMWKDLMKNILPQVEIEMRWMRKVVIETNQTLLNDQNIINAISNRSILLKSQLCSGSELISNILVKLFKMIMIGEIKAHVILAFVNLYGYSAYRGWISLNAFAAEKFAKSFASYVDLFARNIESTESLYLRACDPIDSNWIRNEHFYELEGTFQTAIFRYYWSRCKLASCNAVWFDDLDRCKPEAYDRRSVCSRTTTNCFYLSAIEACALKSGPYKFQYLNSTELGSLGKNFSCPKDNGYMIKDGIGLISSYAACACECHGNHNKISLSIMQSRVASNKVITGLRFFRKNRILYIQPREGTLEANGYIPQSSQKWIPIPNRPNASEIHSIDSDNKIFFLDDLRLPPSHVLTGVKFNKVTRGTVTGFAIEIFGIPFNYESGECLSKDNFETSFEASNINSVSSIEFQKMPPTYARVNNYTPNPAVSAYVSLEKSELSADFGQSTLPFFDAVTIVTSPPSLLGGIGIFHKRADGYSGFISLRVFAIVYHTYLSDFQDETVVNGSVSFASPEHH